MTNIKLKSTISCPECGHRSTETMPEDSCRIFWECPECGKTLTPAEGDCCIYCTYGDIPCPPVQKEGGNSRC